jgi:hypothetical protein
MASPKQRLKTLYPVLLAGLCLAVVGPTQAQANWRVAGGELTANESVAVSTHTEGRLSIAAQKLELLCAAVVGNGLKLIAKSFEAEGKVKFTSCKVWQSGKESPGCKPIEPIVLGIKVRALLHSGATFLLYGPPGLGQPFTIVIFNPAKCALAEENEVTGSFIAECLSKELKSGVKLCEAEEATHLVQAVAPLLEEEINKGLEEKEKDGLSFGENVAVLQGIWSAALNGFNAGKSWSVIS